MEPVEVVIRSRRVVVDEAVRPAAVHVAGGRIAAVTDHDDVPAGVAVETLSDLVLLPGLVDTHVHVNEPGRTEWEGFATATRAAAAGGVTTVVDMPLNSLPPTTTAAALARKRAAAEGQCWVDVGFWGGAVPENLGQLGELHRAGVFGLKCFLADSGVEEFRRLDPAALAEAVATAADLGALLSVHAEAPGPLAAAVLAVGGDDPRRYATWLASRPPEAERQAVAAVCEAVARHGGRAHIVHLSAVEALEPLRRAQADGLAVTAETCPHYLALCAEEIPDGSCAFKCAPPIRDAVNRTGLWRALADGTVGLVVSDHSPCPAELKGSDLISGWGGISSLQLGLAVVWSEARVHGFGIADVARWMSAGPAALVGLDARKGRIAAGCDADLVAFDPESTFTVDPARLEHRHPVTPYAGRKLAGVVRATWLRGRVVYRAGTPFGGPTGHLLERETA